MPCTTILVGKKASYDGSTLMARNEDCGPEKFKPKKVVVVNPEEQPRHYVSVLSGVTIDLPENPMRYTAMPNALQDAGIWGEAGVNACNVACGRRYRRRRYADDCSAVYPQCARGRAAAG